MKEKTAPSEQKQKSFHNPVKPLRGRIEEFFLYLECSKNKTKQQAKKPTSHSPNSRPRA